MSVVVNLLSFGRSVDMRVRHQETDDEEKQVYGRTDHRRAGGAGGGSDDGGSVPGSRDQRADVLSLWTALPLQVILI